MQLDIQMIHAGKYTSGYDNNTDCFAIKIDPKLTVHQLRERAIKRLIDLNYSREESANAFNAWALIDSKTPDKIIRDAIGVPLDANYFYHFIVD